MSRSDKEIIVPHGGDWMVGGISCSYQVNYPKEKAMKENIEISLDSATNVDVHITKAYDYTDQTIDEELL